MLEFGGAVIHREWVRDGSGNRWRRSGLVGLMLLMSLGAVIAPARPASSMTSAAASKPVIVSMGDSFSSGEANPPFDSGTNDAPFFGSPFGRRDLCHRSGSSFPRLLGATNSTQIACSGALISDVIGQGRWSAPDDSSQIVQLRALAAIKTVGSVIITIGGNDLRFGDELGTCVAPFTSCVRDLDAKLRAVDEVTTRLRDQVYPKIRATVGAGVPIIVVGYPRLFPTIDRTPVNCTWLGNDEQKRVNQVQDKLDSSTQAAVRDTRDPNIQYVSVLDTSKDHELCTTDSWFYPVQVTCKFGGDPEREKSFCGHPLQKEHDAIAMRVAERFPRKPNASALGCGTGCVITSQTSLRHPSWGFVTLLTTTRPSSCCDHRDGMFVVVDRDDRVLYRSRTLKSIATQGFELIRSAPGVDRSKDDGNIFVRYNQGIYDGVIVLRPNTSGFDDFGSIPAAGSTFGKYYSAQVVFGNGPAAIVDHLDQEDTDNIPTINQWNGSRYVAVPKPDLNVRSCPPMLENPPSSLAGAWINKATIPCSLVRTLVNHRRSTGPQVYVTDGFTCVRWTPHIWAGDGGSHFTCASGSRYAGFVYI